jgi:hypothetical protein
MAHVPIMGIVFTPWDAAAVRKGSQIDHGSKLELAKRVCDPLVKAVSRSACVDSLP